MFTVQLSISHWRMASLGNQQAIWRPLQQRPVQWKSPWLHSTVALTKMLYIKCQQIRNHPQRANQQSSFHDHTTICLNIMNWRRALIKQQNNVRSLNTTPDLDFMQCWIWRLRLFRGFNWSSAFILTYVRMAWPWESASQLCVCACAFVNLSLCTVYVLSHSGNAYTRGCLASCTLTTHLAGYVVLMQCMLD